ncbi:MAG: RNA 3'-terminal phosphate cyclase [Chloroflexota bacterium]|jgi:RNA 3'-terminal phosphate cyclase (ATP)
MLTIDGRLGEGGGQVLRTSLSLSALTGRPLRLIHIRAKRSKPGLRPQHLTAVRAVAQLCGATLVGDDINSQMLEFRPTMPSQPGIYEFDVADTARGGSAGSMMLILQALLWPMLFAGAPSRLTLRGGTHVPMSPPFHFIDQVFRPAVARMGAVFTLDLRQWGWFPVGGGEVAVTIEAVERLDAPVFSYIPPERVAGVAAVTNLPADIPQRMAGRATNLLAAAGLSSRILPVRGNGPGPGAGLFLWLPQGGFSALGHKGLPADKVAEEAVAETLAFVDNKTMVDRHLADQLLLPLALCHGRARFTTDHLTLHTTTNAELLRLWLGVNVDIKGDLEHPAEISIEGIGFTVD